MKILCWFFGHKHYSEKKYGNIICAFVDYYCQRCGKSYIETNSNICQ